jgi:hypothetical protein
MPDGSSRWLPLDVVGRTGISDRHDAETIAVGQCDELGLDENNRSSGLDWQYAGLGLVQIFKDISMFPREFHSHQDGSEPTFRPISRPEAMDSLASSDGFLTGASPSLAPAAARIGSRL